MEKVQIKLSRGFHRYEINFARLETGGDWAKKCLPETTRKIVIISNKKVFDFYGEIVKSSFEKNGFEVFRHLIGDGEKYKNWRVLENALEFLSENKIKRTDAVVALGGGVVGDLAGFAASIHLRGISFLQIPTTALAMIDSSVGGKTAVNTKFGKNLIGTFYQPHGVLIDAETLQTLPRRELTAGFCEAVKQGAIASPQLFNQTAGFLRKYSLNSFKTNFADADFLNNLQKLLAAQVAFKAEIVARDEHEDPHRTDSRSRKILNFGHTVAHALEKITGYKRFKHGEAVGYGMLVAGEISKGIDIFDKNELNSLNEVVRLTGKLPMTNDINTEKLIEAFLFDKKTTDKSLQLILLETIGKPKIIARETIPDAVIKNALEKVLKNKLDL